MKKRWNTPISKHIYETVKEAEIGGKRVMYNLLFNEKQSNPKYEYLGETKVVWINGKKQQEFKDIIHVYLLKDNKI